MANEVVGISNNPPYDSASNVSVVTAGGTTSLCVSPGIPLQGQVSNFVNYGQYGGNGGTVNVATIPIGFTFYCFNLMQYNTNVAAQNCTGTINVVNNGVTIQTIGFAIVNGGTTIYTNSPTAILIAPTGSQITITNIGGNLTNYGISLIGYLIAGTTN